MRQPLVSFSGTAVPITVTATALSMFGSTLNILPSRC